MKSNKEQLVVKAIKDGTVIDHIPAEHTLLAVEHLTTPEDCYFIGVNLKSTSQSKKGIIKIQDKYLSDRELEVLAVLAPMATVNEIKEYEIFNKKHMETPHEVNGLFICANQNCICNQEAIVTRFNLEKSSYRCQYCERTFPVERLKIQRASI